MKNPTSFKKTHGLARGLFSLVAAGVGLIAQCHWVYCAQAPNPAAIFQEMHQFSQLGSVMLVAAHPDDENTQLLTYLARGRNYRTAYLSITRGDGGQNLLGPEFGDELGVIRTQELLSARRLDGAVQFFTRARDFGFSKDYKQTLAKWDHKQVLADVVRAIRTFRPDVLVNKFSTLPGNTHGHHTASAVLGLEAFEVCGDPKAFPEQLTDLAPWKPKRLLINGFGLGLRRADQLVPDAAATTRGSGTTQPSASTDALRIDISGNDPVLGVSFGELARRSRAMHKTQGFGNYGGNGGGGGPRYENFQLLGGEPATKDIMDGVDTTWARVSGGAEIAQLIDEAIANFKAEDPSASVPALLQIKSKLAALSADPIVDEKRRQFDHILQECLGLDVETEVPEAEVVPGEALKLHHTATVRSNIAVKWIGVRYPSISREVIDSVSLQANQTAARDIAQTLPVGTTISQPYWLREESTPGMFRVVNSSLIGRPENPPAFPVEYVFEVGGQRLTVLDEPVQIITDATQGESRRRLDVIPPVSLSYLNQVQLFPPGGIRQVTVEVTAFRANVNGSLHLEAPEDWKVVPGSQVFTLAALGQKAQLSFSVTAPAKPITANITAFADIDGAHFSNQRKEIRYSHIPVQLLQPPARLKAVCLDLAIRGHLVGYLPGAGDSTAQSLEQMGYAVTTLSGADLTADRLKDFDAVVVGIRAFNTRADLAGKTDALFGYVRNGGNVIVQYNTPGQPKAPLAPFDITISRDLPHNRVTDENAPVTLLVPEHPAFNIPNKIVPSDFDGWVQERGLNFPNQWDQTNFTALLACSDPGEAPLKSGLLVAHYGKGYFVYTGLSWFRQLPAGVPGAYRLFANLVSLGK
ncbi:MAG: PIG-L family deacetylase [Planctomycetota bacterium]|nr:PIG-L family deacetylase [Planctomycetota bacterium]